MKVGEQVGASNGAFALTVDLHLVFFFYGNQKLQELLANFLRLCVEFLAFVCHLL